jgi:translocation and assembly module TamA
MPRFPRLTAALPVLLTLLLSCLWAPGARASIRIEVAGVEGALKDNVSARLSLERYKDRDRLEADAVQRLFERVDGEVRAALRPFGYYEPKVEAQLKELNEGKNWRVDIQIEPGVAVHVKKVTVEVTGPGAKDPVFTGIVGDPGMGEGQQLNHASYEKLKGSLQRAAASNGYLDARMLRNEMLVDLTTHEATIDLALETGQRYRFGVTTIEQKTIRPDLVRRYLRYSEGDPYDAVKVLRTQFAIDDSQYFSNVEVVVGERDHDALTVPIAITAGPTSNNFSLAAGYGSDTGPRGTINWTDRRINDLGHRLRVQIQASAITQQITARYDVPFGDPALEKMSLYGVAEQNKVSDTVSTSELSATPSVTQVKGRWQRVLQVTMAHDITDDPINGRQVVNLAVPGITYASVPDGYLGEDLFSRQFQIELLGSHPSLGAHAPFLRLDVQAERVFDLSAKWHLLLRGEVGAGLVDSVDDLPGTYRFFAGGDRSVRGFGYDDLSPIAVSSTGVVERIGGRDLFTSTYEIERDLPRNLGIAAFTDVGNAFNHFGDPLAVSVGIGLRFRLPVLTVGIDIAQAIRAPGYDSLPGPRLHLNISPKL